MKRYTLSTLTLTDLVDCEGPDIERTRFWLRSGAAAMGVRSRAAERTVRALNERAHV